MKPPVILSLPWPPSANHAWIMVNNKPIPSPKTRKFRKAVREIVEREACVGAYPEQKVSVTIIENPPDRRVRDIDNPIKSLLDALTKSGLWGDDRQIDELTVRRGTVVKGGEVKILAFEIEGKDDNSRTQ